MNLLGALMMSDKVTPFYPPSLFFQVQVVKPSKGFCHHEEKRWHSLENLITLPALHWDESKASPALQMASFKQESEETQRWCRTRRLHEAGGGIQACSFLGREHGEHLTSIFLFSFDLSFLWFLEAWFFSYKPWHSLCSSPQTSLYLPKVFTTLVVSRNSPFLCAGVIRETIMHFHWFLLGRGHVLPSLSQRHSLELALGARQCCVPGTEIERCRGTLGFCSHEADVYWRKLDLSHTHIRGQKCQIAYFFKKVESDWVAAFYWVLKKGSGLKTGFLENDI